MSKLGTGEFTNVKVLSDASAALRRSYRPTNQVLGEGMFGKVFIFTSRDQEEDQMEAATSATQMTRTAPRSN